ncbi:J protein JJJ2 [Vigna unguiculata]|uniref:J protein JJJ2 n=1 Tax=Vigna unguiculata TaxID=3917 RepID=UPI001015CF89|nr:J protein JJJ2 [Vigna unguiculata]
MAPPLTDSEPESEALRLKAMAESKFKASNNAKSALKYAKRAQRLCPHLAGVSEAVTSLTVLAAPDWYSALGAEPFANSSVIRRQYKKLALLLHPDKNPNVASEEAFKLVGEAFHLLSDRSRRREYDAELRRKIKAESETFWTACSTCRLLHQFQRKYMGQELVCPSCEKSFKAVETVQSDGDGDGEGRVRSRRLKLKEINKKKEKIGVEGRVDNEVGDEKEGKLRKRMRSVGEVLERSKPSKRVKNGEEMMTLAEFQTEVRRKLQEKKLKEKEKEKEDDRIETRTSQGERRRALKNFEGLEKEKEDDRIETRNNQGERRRALKNFEGLEKEKEDDRIETRSNQGERRRALKNFEGLEVGEGRALKKSATLAIEEKRVGLSKRKGLRSARHRDSDKGELENMAVVDSDFYDFDKDRVERSFKKGQLWAVYDDDDGMPRNYALIDEILSLNPFEVRLSWLDVQISGDGRIVSREKMGFHIPCGRFKVARKTSVNSVNIFSHVVDCDRAARELYKIYPKKGSVWALHGEGSIDAEERKRCYDIVICLTSYNEANGLSMAYLEKVDGYKTVFRRQENGSGAIIFLGKDDMCLVSHQIPARKLICDETPELLKDCWELDPASLPSDLLTIGGIDN